MGGASLQVAYEVEKACQEKHMVVKVGYKRWSREFNSLGTTKARELYLQGIGPGTSQHRCWLRGTNDPVQKIVGTGLCPPGVKLEQYQNTDPKLPFLTESLDSVRNLLRVDNADPPV